MEEIILIMVAILLLEMTYLVFLSRPSKLAKKSSRPIFVDTSVLIDGRIVSIANSGFLYDSVLYIPRSVVRELQFLADNSDNEKRARARHGLDVVSELQDIKDLQVEIFADGLQAKEGVDERLLKLAKKHSGAVCTIDYNLNKVAQVEQVPVLNVNDLAMSLRMAYLPGEKAVIELINKGQDGHQAVGHLGDGTMVVVEHASNMIGQSAEVEFIRGLQTAAGKMMFARLAGNKKQPTSRKSVSSNPKPKNDSGRQPRNNSGQSRGKEQNNKKSSPRKSLSSKREEDLINLVNSQR